MTNDESFGQSLLSVVCCLLTVDKKYYHENRNQISQWRPI